MRDYRLWEIKYGRISTGAVLVAANSFDEAVTVAVEYIRVDQPNWDANQNDITSVTRTNNVVYLSSSGEQLAAAMGK